MAAMSARPCSLASLPESVGNLQMLATLNLYNCSSLASVVIPGGVTAIGSEAFLGCSSLASVTIPEGVTKIGAGAFRGCSWLVAAVLPQACDTIAETAFEDCEHLSLVVAPDALEVRQYDEDEDEYIAGGSIANVFEGCPLLRPPAYVTPHTPAAVAAAQRLEYWTTVFVHVGCCPSQPSSPLSSAAWRRAWRSASTERRCSTFRIA